jgi:hypothetical protein
MPVVSILQATPADTEVVVLGLSDDVFDFRRTF